MSIQFPDSKIAPGEKRPKGLSARKTNPCLLLYGAGPESTTCATCTHLHALHMGGTYYKCDLRRLSRSAATDHRMRWPACGKYEAGGPHRHAGQ